MTHRWSKASRHARGYGSAWDRLRAEVLSAEPLCRVCAGKKRVTAATNVDHIIAKSKGGTDEVSNLRPLCDECRRVKDAADRGARLRPRIGVDGWAVDE
ncbi:MAG: HNH endonuclease signature motif containing protein [Burkholderiaceae bacterium]|nr:HNH endonuclease signature motif containing protein [Burkholderiaceae bacterium]